MVEEDNTEPLGPIRVKQFVKLRGTKLREVKHHGSLLNQPPCMPKRHDMPDARSGHRSVADGNFLYVFGGYNRDFVDVPNPAADSDPDDTTHYPLFQELWILNLTTLDWLRVKNQGDVPTHLASHSMVAYKHCLLSYGGTAVPFGLTSSNTLSACSVSDFIWSTLPCEGHRPPALYGQAVCEADGWLYAMGGTTGTAYKCSIHALDLQTLTWHLLFSDRRALEQGSPMPEPRYRHEITVYKKRLFVFGGGTSNTVCPLDKLDVFDLKNRKWTIEHTVGRRPQPRRCHSCVVWKECVYVCGGCASEERIFADVWRLELASLQWTRLAARMPEPVYFHSAALTPEGRMLVVGGVTRHHDRRTASAYELWLDAPTLAELAWRVASGLLLREADRADHPRPFVQVPPVSEDSVGDVDLDFERRLRRRRVIAERGEAWYVHQVGLPKEYFDRLAFGTEPPLLALTDGVLRQDRPGQRVGL